MPSNITKRWRQWRQLNRRQQKLFLAALPMLPVTDLLLRAFRYQDFYKCLKVLVPLRESSDLEGAQKRSAETAAIVELAARLRVINSSCLRRSLVLWMLLRWQGIKSDVRLGIGKQDGKVTGHAWVEMDGVVVNDSVDVVGRYLTINPDNLS